MVTIGEKDMKTSFIQVFDSEGAAREALGAITRAFPEHLHSPIRMSNQVQVRAKVDGTTDTKTYGAPDDDTVFLVLSIAPD